MKMEEIEKILRSHPFVVPKFLDSYHIQTFGHKLISYFKTKLPKSERKYIKLTDDSQIAADCLFQVDKKTSRPTIIILSGFDGYKTKGSPFFAESLSHKAYCFGFNVIHLYQRGQSDTIHLTKSLFSADPLGDTTIALKTFASWGLKNFYFVGNSGGGWAALFVTAKLKSNIKKQILGVVSISGPINHFSTLDHVKNNYIYNRLLLYFYKNLVKRRIKVDPQGTWNMNQLKAIKSVRQWGETYIHTSKKFQTIEDYHKGTNLAKLLPDTKISTLIINAKDDPIIPIKPFMKLENPFIITLFPEHGGHSGFFTTKKLYGDLDGHWAQNRAMEFIRLLESGIRQ